MLLQSVASETFCFVEKRLLPIFKVCTSSNLLFFYGLLIGPQPSFLECIANFACNLIGQLCPSGPCYGCRTFTLTVQGMCDVQNLIFSRFLKEESEISIQKDFGHMSYAKSEKK